MSNENDTDEDGENDNNFNSTNDDMSTINGKPVDATANLIIYIDLNESTLPIEKVFGVMLKESNVVLKFNTIVTVRKGGKLTFLVRWGLGKPMLTIQRGHRK
jgi:hypothetical protein